MGHTTYTTVVFMQDSEGIEALDIEDAHGTDALFEHLRQWDYGDNYELPRDAAPWGSRDHTYTYPYGEDDTYYVMAVNRGLGYVSLNIVDARGA